MKTLRILKHLLTTHGQVTRAFPRSALNAIEAAIKASEAAHAGEIRFVVEGSLDGMPLFKGQSPRSRAIELFAQLRVWDTEHNNGLLIYLLLADRAVEIVADRGIHARIGAEEWSKVCRQMEAAFKQSNYEGGVIGGVLAAKQHLVQHFPVDDQQNELPDRPVVL
ncbi:MAG: TPM domain-containing protein [Polaromonas sp.]|uniref:TPM domain-containing protein n=1 Tax=Polaromonas sp. TaxID=1869339 RepID=UPI0025EE7951|nr:TPM domain-containing protein [Polaromonas sp.]MBI2728453.1 TPM domain-containing protein [Polaromonas sp.]